LIGPACHFASSVTLPASRCLAVAARSWADDFLPDPALDVVVIVEGDDDERFANGVVITQAMTSLESARVLSTECAPFTTTLRCFRTAESIFTCLTTGHP
jgi:hypothetical protein